MKTRNSKETNQENNVILKNRIFSKAYIVIVAAGKGLRVGGPIPKQLIRCGGVTILERNISVWTEHNRIDGICVVAPMDGSLDSEYSEIIERIKKKYKKRVFCVRGGAERGDSVKEGLKAVFRDATRTQGSSQELDNSAIKASDIMVMIHDAARPGIDGAVIDRNISAMKTCEAVVTAVPSIDSIRIIDNSILKEESLYPIMNSNVIERACVYNIQTPQTFCLADIMDAYHKAEAIGYVGTDDASVANFAGMQVGIVEGSYTNSKITTSKDVPMTTRVGTGYDVHRLVPNRALILCGTPVPSELGLLGHSDADVATHAIMDALLGASGMRDIGFHFPDSNDEYKDANSISLLMRVKELIGDIQINNIDVTIICEKPKLSPYIEEMRHNIASALQASDSAISIKATTTEGIGFTGRGEGIAAIASCSIEGRF